MPGIHPTAIVDPGAKIDPSVTIAPYAVIGPQVTIGAGSTIGAHSVVEYTQMGKNNKIFPGAYIGGAPQDLKYAGEETMLVMGDNNMARENVTLNRGTAARGETTIGSNCLFMANSHVAHDCVIGNGVIVVNSVGIAGHVEIGDFTVIGGIAGVHQYARIGKYCMVGGGSMVGKDLPDFCNCQGDRATLRGLNLLGMRRAGLPRETVAAIREGYKTLFLSGMTMEAAIAELRASRPVAELSAMLDFIERSKRGIMRPATAAEAEEEVTI